MASATYARSSSAHFTRRTLSLSSPRAAPPPPHRRPLLLTSLVSSLFVVSLALVFCCALYLYLIRNPDAVDTPPPGRPPCDVFDGSWVPDDSYPLYNSSGCPFAERGFNCLANGRGDTRYLRWRWRPRGCDVPRFDAGGTLERLRGKRVVFVGDSMSRTQWESLICMLMTGVRGDRSGVYEVNGNKISKTIPFLGVRFRSFNLRVDFFRSVFLIQQGTPPRHSPKRVHSTLRLDRLDDASVGWVDADVLVFNSGHWWNPLKLFDAGCYFQIDGSLKLGMSINVAFRTALETWASWVETMVNTNRTRVFFRTFEPFTLEGLSPPSPGGTRSISGLKPKVCEVTQQPMADANGNDQSVFSDIIADVVSKMRVPVTVLNVTSMGAVRSDAHIGRWSDSPSVLDCSHWCLPGVPDMWNEILFSYLLTHD